MSKKGFVIILTLSVVVTVVIPFVEFLSGVNLNGGFPFRFSSFDLLGSDTNYLMLGIDIIFWFLVILIIWKVLLKILKK